MKAVFDTLPSRDDGMVTSTSDLGFGSIYVYASQKMATVSEA